MVDKDFMQLALEQAELAFDKGEVPIGAVVVDANGNVIGIGHNLVENNHTQSDHAELIAMRQAGQKKSDWRLKGCTIYITLEPCAMCMSAILLSRVSKVVFSLSSPLFGYRVDKQISFALYTCPIEIREGILEEETGALLRSFFEKRRRSE